jgi:hypothetical protein
VPGRQRLSDEGFDHITVLAMRKDKHAIGTGDAHRREDGTVVQAQAAIVGCEDLEGRNARIPEARDLPSHRLIELRQVHMERVVDGGLGFRCHTDGLGKRDDPTRQNP